MKKQSVAHTQPIPPSELIYDDQHRIYHLGIAKENVAETILLVGDPGRVKLVASFFDTVEFEASNREYNTATGTYNGKRISVLSTGIGTDNMEIALTELDALFNVDPLTRKTRDEFTKLNLVRIGTSGSLQPDIPVDTALISSFALGLDNLNHYYNFIPEGDEVALEEYFTQAHPYLANSYIAQGSQPLIDQLADLGKTGVTLTAPGFFGPQGRQVRLPLKFPEVNDALQTMEFEGHRLTNYEMETSALYAIAGTLGHEACTICAIIANRYRKEYGKDYKKTVAEIIEGTLRRLTIE